jgi:protein O-GlcNAc transferase
VLAESLAEAVRLLQVGRFGEASTLLEPVCSGGCPDARAWFLLGACRSAQRAFDMALAAFDRAIELDPGNAELHFSAGCACEGLDDLPSALTRYERALALDPRCAGALQNRGIVLTRLGRVEEAVESNRAFAAAFPDRTDAHYNLAESCLAARRYDEAISACDAALALDAGHALARLDRGLALAASERIEEARADLGGVIARRDPAILERARAWAAAAGLVDAPDLGVLFQPEDVHLIMGCERLERCEWDGLEAFLARCTRMLETAPYTALCAPAIAFRLLYTPVSAAVQKAAADRIAAAFEREAATQPRAKTGGATRDRLRIGYLSAGFGLHATAHLTHAIYRLHDRGRFEVFGYSLLPDDCSATFAAIATSCERFADLHGLPSTEVARRIAEDGIDILVDMNGYMRDGRPLVLAMRPAPVQISYAGYPATLGGRLADYLVVDRVVAPPGADSLYAEKLVRLPGCYLPASHRSLDEAVRASRSSEGLPDTGTVFCAFNRHEKIGPAIFASWARILRAVPGSVLWLLQGPGRASLLRHAADAGVDPGRLVFAERRDIAAHLARQCLANLFLDTPGCNAHTTAIDALWCRVPVVTIPGEHMAARVAASALAAIGMEELARPDLGEYEALAIALARDPDELARLRTRLARNRDTHPLFDTERHVRNLEGAYLEMWRIHEAGEPPRAFDVRDPAPFAPDR